MRGVFEELEIQSYPAPLIEEMKQMMDCKIDFFGNTVSEGIMFAILIGTDLLLIGGYVLMNRKRACKGT